ncbi:MAG: DUF2079 domain-containing protein, partial [Oligoflexia bacterium]|nr:DUF2079 domain-containing protein [Oligoflexia bacterium]
MNNFTIIKTFYYFVIATFIIPFIFSGFSFWPSLLSNQRNFFLLLIVGTALFCFNSNVRSYLQNLFINLESSGTINQKLEQRIVIGISLFYLFSYIKMVILNYYSFAVDGIDFSIVDHMLAYTAAGNFMYHPIIGCNHFGIHSTPFFLLLYPLHSFFSHPFFFLLLHPIVLWSAVIPLYLLMKKFNLSPIYKFIILFLFFNYNPVIRVLRYNFHFEVFYIPLFLWLFYFFEKKKCLALFVIAVIINCIKEDAALYLFFTSIAMATVLIMRSPQKDQKKVIITLSL